MRTSGRIRRLLRLLPWPGVLLAACGGGDKGPAGPGGDGSMRFELVSVNRAPVPADLQLEDCSVTRFYNGRLDVTDDGSWEIGLEVHDFQGDWGYLDAGEVDEDGTNYWFASEHSGSVYQGAMEGSRATILYDWCYDGAPDIQLVFER